jgi:hypothetical protein
VDVCGLRRGHKLGLLVQLSWLQEAGQMLYMRLVFSLLRKVPTLVSWRTLMPGKTTARRT